MSSVTCNVSCVIIIFFPDKVAELVVGGSVINVANMFAIVHRLWVMKSDLLKANSFAQPNCLTNNFAQRNGPKLPLKHVKFRVRVRVSVLFSMSMPLSEPVHSVLFQSPVVST